MAHGRRPFKPSIITWKPSHNITPLCSTARNHRSDFTAECTFSSSFPYKAVMVVGGGLNWVFSGASRSFQDRPTLGRQLNTSHQLQMVPHQTRQIYQHTTKMWVSISKPAMRTRIDNVDPSSYCDSTCTQGQGQSMPYNKGITCS